MSDVTAVIINYNGVQVLSRTLQSLHSCGFGFHELILVDDGSTDGSLQWVRQHWPAVKIIAEPHTGRVALLRSKGLAAVATPYAFLTDNDISVFPGTIEALLDVMRSDERIFCTTPRLLDEDHPDRIYTDGNYLHFTALGAGLPRNVQVTQRPAGAPFPSIGGGVMLLEMHKARHLGFFDAGYVHGWGDDGEIHARGIIAGYRVLHVPEAVCLHKAQDHGVQRAYGQIYNRYRMLLTVYRVRSLLLLSPSLLLVEIGLTFMALRKGFWRERWQALADTWRNRHELLKRRRAVQSQRRAPDKWILQGGTFELPGVLLAKGGMFAAALRLARGVFDMNWRLVSAFL